MVGAAAGIAGTSRDRAFDRIKASIMPICQIVANITISIG
jgi:hypothetical protein